MTSKAKRKWREFERSQQRKQEAEVEKAKRERSRRRKRRERGKPLSQFEVYDMFPDDRAAERWFEKLRWPHGIIDCPRCLSWATRETPERKPMAYWCKKCRRHFNVRTGTVMAGTKLGYRTWALAIHAFISHPKGVSSIQTCRDLKITQKTAWFLNHRIREAMAEELEDGDYELFEGPVEVDETYVGGKARNMHHEARKRNRERYEYGKAIVVGLRDRKTKKVRAMVVTKANRKQLQSFIKDRTYRSTTVYTDEAKAYKKGLEREHGVVNHSKWQFAVGDCYTNGIESLWATLKRMHKGTYHSMSHQHMQRYLDEVCGRHNMRRKDAIKQMREVVAGMVGKRLLYRELTGRVQSR